MVFVAVLLVTACGGGSSSGGGQDTSPFTGQYSGTISINGEDASNFAPGATGVLINIRPNGALQFFIGGVLIASGPVGADGQFSISGPLSDIGGEGCTEGSYTLSGTVTSTQANGALAVTEGECNGFPVSPGNSPFATIRVEE